MIKVTRSLANPILSPNEDRSWEKEAVFNGSVVRKNDKYCLVYRAMSSSQIYYGSNIELSTLGYAESEDGIHFSKRKKLIFPEYDWEKFGCEDPRVTKLGTKYYIFYTALSDYPHTADGIKVGLAVTSDFEKIEKKCQVTNFNSKAMALFPEKIGGKVAVLLTVDSDKPPSKIALAYVDSVDKLCSNNFWEKWQEDVADYELDLKPAENDHIEVGSAPIKTEKGWLIFISYIKNYKKPPPVFGIKAILLDYKDPLKIIARTPDLILLPSEDYELEGKVPNIVFPSGALLEGDHINIYYGAADNYVCLAQIKTKTFLKGMLEEGKEPVRLRRFAHNPIIKPNPENSWENKFTFNPAAVYEGGKVHIVYRAMSDEGKSVFGYASAKDGIHIDERLSEPIYLSREDLKKKINPIYHSCEDPRITKIGDKLYMCYTAFDGKSPTVVALTSIKIKDFLEKNWKWKTPRMISNPIRSDKNTCVFPEKVNGKYVFLHRLEHKIWIDYHDDLEFTGGKYLAGKEMMLPREGMWDSDKIGIAGPPIKTEDGWLLIYHGLSLYDKKYRLSAVLLDLKNPGKVLGRLKYPIIEPEKDYENVGDRPGTIFSCGSVVIKDKLYVYYGAADQVIGVADCDFQDIIDALKLSDST